MTKLAVLWDVDGTLSDSYMLGYTCTNKVLHNNGKDVISESEYHAGTKYTTPHRFAWHVTRDPNDEIGVTLGKQFDDLYVGMVTIETVQFYPGIMSLLLDINEEYNNSNITFGALSNACGAYARAVLQANNVDNLFEVAYGADEVPAPKPHALGLQQICRELNISPDKCIYIGDAPTDGQAAAAAGMRSIGVTWGSHAVESVVPAFTHTVHSVDELKVTIQLLLNECIAS